MDKQRIERSHELIQQFIPIGKKFQGYGIRRSVLYAIILKESRNLNSTLTTLYNNCGGVKGRRFQGYNTVFVKTTEVDNGKVYKTRARFRVFDNLNKCVEKMCQSLCNSRYRHFREATSLYEACLALQDNYGFAPGYGESLYVWVKELGFEIYDDRKDVKPFLVMKYIPKVHLYKMPRAYRSRRAEAIRILQGILNSLGFMITIDGKFGNGTRKIVKAYQKKVGLKSDGKVGIITWLTLSGGNMKKPIPVVQDIEVIEEVKFTGSKNFKPSEFLQGKSLPSKHNASAQYTIDKLQEFRDWIGRPVTIKKNGGYTTSGHSSTSFHYIAVAIDIYIKGMTTKELAMKLLEYYESEFYKRLKNGEYPSEDALKQLGIGLGGSSIVHIDFGHWAKQNGFENYGNKRPAYWFYNGYNDLEDWYKRA